MAFENMHTRTVTTTATATAPAAKSPIPDPRPNAPENAVANAGGTACDSAGSIADAKFGVDSKQMGTAAFSANPLPRMQASTVAHDDAGTAVDDTPKAAGVVPNTTPRASENTSIPAIEHDRARAQADFETAESQDDAMDEEDSFRPHTAHITVEVPETIEATIDFSEVELADEFAEPPMAVTPGGILPMEPSPVEGRLRKAPLRVPDELEEAGGFTLFGRRIKSLLYTTDVAVIRNSNADAIFAVYPFTAQPAITQALLTASESPVFVGVGGGTTTGKRAVQLAAVSEMQGAAGVVVNSPAPPDMIEQIASIVDIPVVATVVRCDAIAHAKVKAGAKILNVAAGKDTPAVLRELRAEYPNLPLIASGGRSSLSVRETVQAGANAVIWTPPSAQQLQADMMKRYRSAEEKPAQAYMDPIAAADLNPQEAARADIPIPDELIAKATTTPRKKGGFTPLSFFRGKKRR